MSVPLRKRYESKLECYSKTVSFRKHLVSYFLNAMDKFEDKIPEWFLKYFRWEILKKVTELVDYVSKASSITMIDKKHFDFRQDCFLKAKGCCESLVSSFNFLIDLYPNRIKIMESAISDLDKIRELINNQMAKDIDLYR